jgi:hypothetical protein
MSSPSDEAAAKMLRKLRRMNARSEAKAAALEVMKDYNVSIAGGAASKS